MLSNNMPRIVKENIYCTFIRPLIEYGCMIYDNCPTFISHSIEQVQRRAALACNGALLKEVGMAYPLKTQRILQNLYKLQNQISPAYMVGHLPLNRADHVYVLINNNDIRVPLFHSETHLFHLPYGFGKL